MRRQYLILCMALFAMLVAYCTLPYSQSTSIGSASINASINSTAAYINTVNQSGYLVFYPQLAQAYNYLNLAKNISAKNASAAYSLLAMARSSAQSQELSLQHNERYLSYGLIAASLFLGLLLYALMRPPLRRGNVTNGKKIRQMSKF